MDKIFKLLLSAALLLCCIMLNAQQPAGDGSQADPYQIATSDNLVWFAGHVNSGNTTACAILTANITMNAGVLDSNGNLNSGTFTSWTPIGGQNNKDFAGEFNGNGHTISGLYFNSDSRNNVGLFGKAVDNAYIHDLGIKDSYFYGKDHVGGICGDFASGRIENCWNGATVYAKDWNAGGISGSCWIYASIGDCYNIGKIIPCDGSNPSYGGICGAVYENTGVDYTISNCHTLEGKCDKGVYGSLDDGCPASKINNSFVKDAAAFASGEVCWLLNNGVTGGSQKWFQTLGTDNFPVLDNSHGTVYYGYDGDVLKYSNSPLDPSNMVSYIDANGVEQTVTATVVTNEASTLSAGWYVVTDSNVQTGTLVCNGAVHLILADGAKLTATGNDDNKTPGIQVSGDGNSFAVYGQSAQSGQLEAVGGNWAAGIGGGWHANHFGNGSNITINGGIVTATGGQSGAGIGGGQGGNGTHITINGGNVTATGGQNAAGIGGGLAGTSGGLGSYITITGGTVTATGGNSGAGIGGGSGMPDGPCLCSNITITGGKVTANGGSGASGIGGSGLESPSSNIIIAATLLVKADNFNNPPTTVIPNTGSDLAGSLNGKQHVTAEPIIITYGEYITVSPEFESGDNVPYGTYTFTAADRSDDEYELLGFYKDSTFDTPITEGVSGYVYTLTVNEAAISVYAKYRQHFNVPYIDADGQEQTADAVEITSGTLNAGWYVVRGSDENHGPLTCNGAVHIILADDAKLTATGLNYVAGITVSGDGNSLTIYGQTAQSGKLIANGDHDAAGIGGGNEQSGSNITINGGIVTANGGGNGAGIGGGGGGSGSDITINGGTVTASGGLEAAGIGGGGMGNGSNITINGGTVTANGNNYGAGIGGGSDGSGSHIIINDGTVTATGKSGAAGIGGGRRYTDTSGESAGSGSYITINGGVVTATGGDWASGIGGGYYGFGSYITINGGTVTAKGGDDGAGIGGGYNSSGSDIFVVPELIVRAGNDNPPTTVIAHTATTDIAGDLAGKRYATVRIPQGGIVTYGEYITVSPQFTSGDRVAAETDVTFTAADRFAENYEFLGFYKDSTFENKITQGVNGNVYTATVFDDDISVYAKYEEFIPTPYIDANGQEQSVKTTEITTGTSTLSAGWYVVTGSDVQTGTLTCNGAVHLILADGAKLTASGGSNQAAIQVSGEGNSLTIYGQTAQSGQLVAKGEYYCAGIGGGKNGNGSDITINGGKVVATGGDNAAGIGGGYPGSGSNITINGGIVIANGGHDGAGIGGGAGVGGSGSNITINGGKVVATGGDNAAGIGGGNLGSGSNITINGGEVTATGGISDSYGVPTGSSFGRGNRCKDFSINITVATALTVYAGDSNPPTTEIVHATGSDIAGSFNGKQYAIVKDEMTDVKVEAIAAINAAIEGVTNEDIIAIATNAINAINEAINVREITIIKEQALAAIASALAAYNSALGEMGEPCTDCPAVDVTKGTTTIRLYNPEKVEFRKME